MGCSGVLTLAHSLGLARSHKGPAIQAATLALANFIYHVSWLYVCCPAFAGLQVFAAVSLLAFGCVYGRNSQLDFNIIDTAS